MFAFLPTRLKQASRWLPVALLPFAAQAQAPANDNCTAAIALVAGATCTPVAGTNANATPTAGQADPTCSDTSTGDTDVWYSVVVPASGGVTVTTSTATGSNVDDTVLELLTGTCGALTSVACNDDISRTNYFSEATARNLTPGTTLYVRVMTFQGLISGAFNICAVSAAPPAVANDDPAGAITLSIAATCTPVNGTNVGATTTNPAGYGNPGTGCGVAVNPKDVWYKFTTPATGPGSTAVTITVTGAPAGYLRLFSTTGGAAGPFTEISCAAGTAVNTVSAPLTVNTLIPGTTYYVFVSGYGSNDTMGPFTICVIPATPLPANDLSVEGVYTLGTVSSYASPVRVDALIRNRGSVTSAARTVVFAVSGATTATAIQNVPAIPVGGSTTVSYSFPITASTGTNTVTVALPNDDVATNNTRSVQQAVSTNRLSYQVPGVALETSGFGSNTTTATVYVKYNTFTTPTVVRAVTATFAGPAQAPGNYQVLILNDAGTNGNPGQVLYTSPVRARPSAGGAEVVSIPGIPVAAIFYVAVRQLSTNNFGLAYQIENPLRVGTFLVSSNGTTFTDLGTIGTPFRAAVDVTLSNPLATRNEALAATVGLYPNPAHQAFKLAIPAGSLHAASATLLNALGQVVQQRQLSLPTAGGTADFNVSGLAAGVYSLQLQAGNDVIVKRVVVE